MPLSLLKQPGETDEDVMKTRLGNGNFEILEHRFNMIMAAVHPS